MIQGNIRKFGYKFHGLTPHCFGKRVSVISSSGGFVGADLRTGNVNGEISLQFAHNTSFQ